jgi:hypothetical protein
VPQKFAIAGLAIGATLGAATARAEPTSADKALAETLFREAKSLIDASRLPEACEKFAESQRLDPRLGTLLHLATCHEETGRLASAWIEYQDAATLAGRLREPERQRLATTRARALEPKLARIRIQPMPGVDGLEIKLDGRKLGDASIGVPIPVDAGPHLLEASARERQPRKVDVAAEAGASLDVTIPPLEALPPPAPIAPPPRLPQPAPVKESPPAIHPLTLALAGAGAAGLVVGTVFGINFFSQRHDGLAECSGSTCSAHGLDKLDDARASSLASGLGFGIGLAAIGAAVVVHVTGFGRGPAPATVAVAPNGVHLTARW